MSDSAALDLHLRALRAASDGDLAAANEAFTAAQAWESSNGYGRAAAQTSHQMALTANFGGDLDRLRRYYQETLGTLKRMRNREGLALCLRSFGEVAWIRGTPDETLKAWELSAQLFASLGLPEARLMESWLASVVSDRAR